MDSPSLPQTRRDFLRLAAAGAAATALAPAKTLAADAPVKIPLGMDNFSVRAMGWKAPQLLDFAASLKLDTLFISDLDSYDSLEDAALRDVKAKADSLGIALYVGSWSICPTSLRFKKNWGTPSEHIALGLRVAKALGSPVFRVVLGGAEDRKTPGGINARIDDTVKVLRENRGRILEYGIPISVENHAGDMQSRELVRLIHDAGPDIVGVNIDSGNAAWTLEDPLEVLETLGPYVNCSSLRDEQIWENEEGAVVQWTAVGEGVIDWPAYLAKWRELCPKVPIQIETISGFPRAFPYLKRDFWEPYRDARAEDFARFVALAKKGHALPPFKAPPGVDKKQADQDYQKAQITQSIKYCRETLGLGVRA
jgi:sugar phosphate isomerase/epimerase